MMNFDTLHDHIGQNVPLRSFEGLQIWSRLMNLISNTIILKKSWILMGHTGKMTHLGFWSPPCKFNPNGQKNTVTVILGIILENWSDMMYHTIFTIPKNWNNHKNFSMVLIGAFNFSTSSVLDLGFQNLRQRPKTLPQVASFGS